MGPPGRVGLKDQSCLPADPQFVWTGCLGTSLKGHTAPSCLGGVHENSRAPSCVHKKGAGRSGTYKW